MAKKSKPTPTLSLEEQGNLFLQDKNTAFGKDVINAQKSFAELAEKVRGEFARRDETINVVLASLASGVPAVLLGPPGTGKSAIVRKIAKYCGLDSRTDDYFEYILTSHTMPEELFGPPDLSALKDGRYRRNTDGMLPNAKFAFLDEVFRGSSQILNTLLGVMNERIFHDGNSVMNVDLVGIIAAANFPPHDSELHAFYDRFPIRTWVESIFHDTKSDKDLRKVSQLLLQKSKKHDRDRIKDIAAKTNDSSDAVADIDVFRVLRFQTIKSLDNILALDDFQEFVRNFKDFRTECRLSDRSFYLLARFAVAWKWLNPKSNQYHDVFQFVAPDKNAAEVIRRKINERNLTTAHGSSF